jgi:hypothetical protein
MLDMEFNRPDIPLAVDPTTVVSPSLKIWISPKIGKFCKGSKVLSLGPLGSSATLSLNLIFLLELEL